MTGEKSMFTSLQLNNDAQEIVFCDSGKEEVVGVGKIPISNDQSISNVLLVDSLSYNLLSVSQLCEMGYNYLFTNEGVQILRREDSSIAFTGRLKGKLYLVDFTTTRVTPEDPDWVIAMQEELNNFTRNEVWSLVERPEQNVIGTKWVFRNKQDENGVVTRNKARLVAQGFTQIEGLDFGETYAPVARLESIRILIAFATHHNFKLYQMDIKSAFLNEATTGL